LLFSVVWGGCSLLGLMLSRSSPHYTNRVLIASRVNCTQVRIEARLEAPIGTTKKGNKQLIRPKSNDASVLSPTFAGPMHTITYKKSNSNYCFNDFHILLAARSLFLAATLVGLIFLFTRNHFSEHHHTIAIHERNTR